MGRRIAREHRPGVEQCERRDLLSAITDVMAGNSIAANMRAAGGCGCENHIQPFDRHAAEPRPVAQSRRDNQQCRSGTRRAI